MKRSVLIVGLLLSYLVSNGLIFAHRSVQKKVSEQPKLLLTTTVSRERSCAPGRLSLDLTLNFRNAGSVPIILDKRSFIERVHVSKSLQQAQKGAYEQQVRADLYDGSYFAVDPTDMSNFIILPPGDSFDLVTPQTRVTLQIAQNNSRNTRQSLEAGVHLLEIELSTWTYFADEGQFRRKWNHQGYLWSKGIKSEPMRFTVTPRQAVDQCR